MKSVLSFLLLTTLAHAVFSDAEIVKTLETINAGEVELSRLALRKSMDPNVDRYAEKMVREHSHNNENLRKLAADLAFAPATGPLSERFAQGAASNRALLTNLEGKQFDRVYVDAMVADHQKVLTALETELIPAAQNSALKEHLQKTREHVATHLHHAQEMQKTMPSNQ